MYVIWYIKEENLIILQSIGFIRSYSLETWCSKIFNAIVKKNVELNQCLKKSALIKMTFKSFGSFKYSTISVQFCEKWEKKNGHLHI